MNKASLTREGWADALRVFAMISVVMLHCAVLPIGTERWSAQPLRYR